MQPLHPWPSGHPREWHTHLVGPSVAFASVHEAGFLAPAATAAAPAAAAAAPAAAAAALDAAAPPPRALDSAVPVEVWPPAVEFAAQIQVVLVFLCGPLQLEPALLPLVPHGSASAGTSVLHQLSFERMSHWPLPLGNAKEDHEIPEQKSSLPFPSAKSF